MRPLVNVHRIFVCFISVVFPRFYHRSNYTHLSLSASLFFVITHRRVSLDDWSSWPVFATTKEA